MRYILASASPRRKELLKYIIEDFECVPADIKEIVPDNIGVFEAPEYLAALKAEHLLADYPNSVIIGSDTAVIIGGEMLGKPKDKNDAKQMLEKLSGKVHTVVTGCAILYNDKKITFTDKTDVEFYPLTKEEIENYIATNEPLDKAGAYGIQGKGSMLVKGIKGDFFSVMGLPVAALYRNLKTFEENL